MQRSMTKEEMNVSKNGHCLYNFVIEAINLLIRKNVN